MENIKQHFVPQYYLKKFAKDDFLYVYDTKQKKLISQKSIHTKNIGFGKNFYDIDPDLLRFYLSGKVSDVKHIDNLIKMYSEDISCTLINSFDNFKDNVNGNLNLFDLVAIIREEDLYDFILVQFFRTPKFRFFAEGIAEIAYGKISEHLKNEKFKKKISLEVLTKLTQATFIVSSLSETKNDLFDNYTKLTSNSEIFSIPAKELKESLNNCIGIMLIANGKKIFKISDNPICVYSNGRAELLPYDLLYVPINKRCAFVFLSKSAYADHLFLDRQIRILNDEDAEVVENFNFLLVLKADRFVYSYDNSFENINKFVNGEIPMKLQLV